MTRPTDRRPRPGFTLLELLVVLAVLVVLGGVVVPTIFGIRGDTRSKAAVDIVRTRMAEARSKAMEDGLAYRFAISSDGKRVRVAPDVLEASGITPMSVDDANTGPLIREDDFPKDVLARVLLDENEQTTQDAAGWVRAGTFQPDGTCKEDSVEIEITESGVKPFVVRLRGLTGATTTSRAGGGR